MSRGPGVVERAILSNVGDEWVSVDLILTTLTIPITTATRSERESVRRAMRNLANNGQVRSHHNERGELEVSEPYEPETQRFVDRFHEVEESGADWLAWLQGEMEAGFAKC